MFSAAKLGGLGNLAGDKSSNQLDRTIVYGLIKQEEFTAGEVLELLAGLQIDTSPEQVNESLTRPVPAFILGRSQNRCRWQAPLWWEQVLAEETRQEWEWERELEIQGTDGGL